MVYPSSLEGFGFPPLEALELGLPVLAGDCAALRETAGDAALFVDGSDPAALAVAIEQLLDEPADARTKAWQQRRRAFTWAECARAHEDAYTSGIEQSA
jgi:glycosyltransferase involved in cell wall biosynthesis